MSESTRALIYRVLVVLIPLLVVFGLVTEETATAIIAAGTGWTITGSLTMTIPVTTGATLIARKSSAPGAASAWTLYRVA